MNDILLETLPAAPPGDIPLGEAFPSPCEFAEREASREEEQRQAEKSAAREFIEEKLAIELILSIRGGACHSLSEVCGALDSFIPVPLAERHFQASNEVEGIPAKRLARGKALLLALPSIGPRRRGRRFASACPRAIRWHSGSLLSAPWGPPVSPDCGWL